VASWMIMNNFLESVESFNAQYSSIKINGALDFLNHYFWSISEIEKGSKIKNDWSVPSHLIPFYGDRHDLFCLDTDNDQVASLNDERYNLYLAIYKKIH
jgi:hypothetical protein